MKIKTHIKTGDQVKIIAGNQKGLIGKIVSIDFKSLTVILDNVTPRIKYRKDTQNGNSKKLEIQLPIHISNVMVWDKEKNQVSRIGYKTIEGKKKRYFKKSGNLV